MINAVIIGLGNIGYKYDLYNDCIISHFKSVKLSKKISLKLIIDPKKPKLSSNENYIKDIKSIEQYDNLDLAIISTPTLTHYKILKFLLIKTEIKYFIIEKPFCNNYRQALEIKSLAQKKRKRLLINYMRNFDKSTLQINNIIKHTKKNYFYGYCFFNGKIENSVSHVLSLLIEILGNYTKIVSYQKNQIFKIYFKKSFILFIKNPSNKKKMQAFDLHINFNNGKLFYENEGQKISWSKLIKSNIYSNEYNYSKKHKKIDSLLTEHGRVFYENAIKKLKDDIYDNKNLLNALKVRKSLDYIKKFK